MILAPKASESRYHHGSWTGQSCLSSHGAAYDQWAAAAATDMANEVTPRSGQCSAGWGLSLTSHRHNHSNGPGRGPGLRSDDPMRVLGFTKSDDQLEGSKSESESDGNFRKDEPR